MRNLMIFFFIRKTHNFAFFVVFIEFLPTKCSVVCFSI